MNKSHEVAKSSNITCYLSTKKGKLQEYALVVTESHLRVFSWTSGNEKTSIDLMVAHAKKVPKEKRVSSNTKAQNTTMTSLQ